MVENRHITADDAKAAKAKPLAVNIRPYGTQIHAADYFAEEVRRSLIGKFGEDKLYGRRPVGAHHARSRSCSSMPAAR